MENQEYNRYGGNYTTSPQSQPFVQQYAQEIPPMKPKNWLTEAILVTVFPICCLCNPFTLLGIVAIVFANKVDNLYFAQRYAEAEQAAKDAKMWVLVTLGIAVLGFIAYVIFTIVLFTNPDFMDAFMQGLESARDGGATQW